MPGHLFRKLIDDVAAVKFHGEHDQSDHNPHGSGPAGGATDKEGYREYRRHAIAEDGKAVERADLAVRRKHGTTHPDDPPEPKLGMKVKSGDTEGEVVGIGSKGTVMLKVAGGDVKEVSDLSLRKIDDKPQRPLAKWEQRAADPKNEVFGMSPDRPEKPAKSIFARKSR